MRNPLLKINLLIQTALKRPIFKNLMARKKGTKVQTGYQDWPDGPGLGLSGILAGWSEI